MTEAGVNLRRPPDRFAWCLINAPGVRRAGVLPPAYLLDLAEEVPVNIDELFAVAAPIAGGKVVVCATLRSELASLDDNVIALTPESIPDGVFASAPGSERIDADPATLNLLVGEFEPRAFRRARQRRHTLAAALVLLAALIATSGLLRRAAHWKGVIEESRAAFAELIASSAPNGDEHALERELAQRRASARASGALATPPDAGVTLAQLLAAWPADVPSKPQSIVITPSGVRSLSSASVVQSVAVSVSVEGDPADFLRAFRTPAGWTMDEPRLNTAGAITRLSLTLRPSSKPATSAAVAPDKAHSPNASSTTSLSRVEGGTP